MLLASILIAAFMRKHIISAPQITILVSYALRALIYCNIYSPTKLCKLAGIECNQDVAVGHFLDHFLRHHHRLGSPTEPLIQGFPLGAGYFDLTRVPMQTKPKYFIIDDHDHIFCLILHTKLRNGLITWRCFAVFYDGFENLPAPEVEITLFIDNEKVRYHY